MKIKDISFEWLQNALKKTFSVLVNSDNEYVKGVHLNRDIAYFDGKDWRFILDNWYFENLEEVSIIISFMLKNGLFVDEKDFKIEDRKLKYFINNLLLKEKVDFINKGVCLEEPFDVFRDLKENFRVNLKEQYYLYIVDKDNYKQAGFEIRDLADFENKIKEYKNKGYTNVIVCGNTFKIIMADRDKIFIEKCLKIANDNQVYIKDFILFDPEKKRYGSFKIF